MTLRVDVLLPLVLVGREVRCRIETLIVKQRVVLCNLRQETDRTSSSRLECPHANVSSSKTRTMPTIPLYPPDIDRTSQTHNPLPKLFQTPSGLALVEIQGTINISAPDASASATSIGKLVFADDKRVYLYVGKYQRMTGEIKKLAKPIAVVRRREVETGNEELEIAEIVYHKLIFAHRPEPVGGQAG